MLILLISFSNAACISLVYTLLVIYLWTSLAWRRGRSIIETLLCFPRSLAHVSTASIIWTYTKVWYKQCVREAGVLWGSGGRGTRRVIWDSQTTVGVMMHSVYWYWDITVGNAVFSERILVTYQAVRGRHWIALSLWMTKFSIITLGNTILVSSNFFYCFLMYFSCWFQICYWFFPIIAIYWDIEG